MDKCEKCVLFHCTCSSAHIKTVPCPSTDSTDGGKAKVTVETPQSSGKIRTANQRPVIEPTDDLTSVLLQVGPSAVDHASVRWCP